MTNQADWFDKKYFTSSKTFHIGFIFCFKKSDHSNWTHEFFRKWVIVVVAQMCLISPNDTLRCIVDTLIQWTHFVSQINP